jgi:hypothetical protein
MYYIRRADHFQRRRDDFNPQQIARESPWRSKGKLSPAVHVHASWRTAKITPYGDRAFIEHTFGGFRSWNYLLSGYAIRALSLESVLGKYCARDEAMQVLRLLTLILA